jgi:hypothetical protein
VRGAEPARGRPRPFERGLHNEPKDLRARLQEAIDDVLVLQPGERLAMSYDDGVIKGVAAG